MTNFVNVNYDLENKSISSANFPLPGGNNQIEHLLEQVFPKSDRVLIIGSATDSIVKLLLQKFSEVTIILDDYESLMNTRMQIQKTKSLIFKMMNYSHTDFEDNHFDLIYTQGSISVPARKNILKEIKRIISAHGKISVGEIISLKEPVAGFVKDIWNLSGLEPLSSSSINKFYQEKGFMIINERELSGSLNDYYEKMRIVLSKVSKEKKEDNRKIFTRMKHESNVYLKLGGDKYMGFKSLILRKPN